MEIPTVQNVIHAYLSASEAHLAKGVAWYHNAHDIASVIDPLRVHRAAGVIAALSPMQHWDINVAKAAFVYARGNDIPLVKNNGVGLLKNVEKALRIYNGEDALDVLGGNKVRAFFLSIADPDGDYPPVIDRHAFDIAVGRKTDDKIRRQLDRKGEYERFGDVYREAAILTGHSPAELQAITWEYWRDAYGG